MKNKIKKQKEYLEKKIDGHGGAYYILDNGRIKTDYVGLKGKFKIFLINIHLWFIWKFK